MQHRLLLAATLVALAAPLAPAVQHRTQNFVVDAPSIEYAQRFGQMAERFRKEKAVEWLGQEMPPWPVPCPLVVKPGIGGAGGATTFDYSRGTYPIRMTINGDAERMLNSVLPHEVTHTVFAHHFRQPLPRFADEGGSVLSEDTAEHVKHDGLCRDMLNGRKAIQLRRLFAVREYEEVSDVLIIYAQGYSICEFLVGKGGRGNFLNFVAMGMRGNWDQAAQTHFRYQSVEAMEQDWLTHLRATKRGTPRGQQPDATAVARGSSGQAVAQLTVRQTVPPAQPQLDPAGPVARGQADDVGTSARPMYLPQAIPTRAPAVPQPVQPAGATLPPVRLEMPVFGAVPQPQPAPAARSNGPSPVGAAQ